VWADDRERCPKARVPEETGFATKSELAKAMIGRAITAGVPFSWVTGDEVHGGNGKLHT
jgi:SRSO17 transposase